MDTGLKAWKYIYKACHETGADPERIALTDGVRSYSYRRMFEEWKRYASVFTALKMSGADGTRAGLMGTTCPEVIFAFYALDMVGAQVSVLSSLNAISPEKIIRDVEAEHLTDLILTDEIITEKTLRELLGRKEKLGLRNIILLHAAVGGSTIPMPVYVSCEAKAAGFRQNFPMLYMDVLLFYMGNTPIRYAAEQSEDSFIMHTSGTTGGSGKPVVLTDLSFNSVCGNLSAIRDYDDVRSDIVSPVIVDLSNVFGMAVQVHAMLSLGATIVTIPGNALNPMLYRAVAVHKITLLFCIGAMADMWMKYPEAAKIDFSSIKMVILGGSYVSAADKKRYDGFFRKHGAGDFYLLNGYGISEVGGVCTLTDADIDDESIGHALPGYELRFFNEDTEEYRSAEDAPCTGVMYIHSQAMTTGVLDGKQIIPFEMIDGKPYVCTNDLIHMDADGKLTYLGRSNRYFLHSDGAKYESGRVETEIARQAGIESCGIVPVFEKVGHDNIPMLCVKVTGDSEEPLETVRQALVSVFVKERTLEASNLPRIVLLAEDLPRNANGKIDLFRINREAVAGQKYSVEPVKRRKKLADIRLRPLKEDEDNMIQSVYKGIAKEIAGDTVKIPTKEKATDCSRMRSVKLQQQMYMSLMMQQNLYLMNCMNGMMNRSIDMLQQIRDRSRSDAEKKGGEDLS